MQPGDRFGRLVVLEVLTWGRAMVQCDCGVQKEVLKRNLASGGTRSCSCLAREVSRETVARLREEKAQREPSK